MSNFARCLVFCAGEDDGAPVQVAPDDFIICCDAGYRAAQARGIVPHLLLGDFDSYRGALPAGVETMRFPVEKDDTDSMLALREGLRRGLRHFVLLFSLGGRLDHTVANLQTLAFLQQQGAMGELRGPRDTVRLLQAGSIDIARREGYTLSIFAYGGTARGVTLQGMQYPLHEAEVHTTFPIGLGNHVLEPVGRVQVREGALLVIESRID